MARLSRPAVGLLIVGLGILAAPLDTAVNIAFPSITQAFDLQVQDIRWVVIAYVLTYASLMLAFGRLGDLLGYRRIFQLGLLVSAAGFAACSLAPTYQLLLLGRVLQGVGIALTLSCAPALAISLYEERERTRVLGIYAAITAAGSALGPLAGGFLVERAGWPSVFWSRAPLVLAALALSWLIPSAPKLGSVRGFDAVGAVLLVTWISALLLVFAVVSEFGMTSRSGMPDHAESAAFHGPVTRRPGAGRPKKTVSIGSPSSSAPVTTSPSGNSSASVPAVRSSALATSESRIDVFPLTKRPVASTRCRRRFSATPLVPTSTASTRRTASPLTGTMEILETRASRAEGSTRPS